MIQFRAEGRYVRFSLTLPSRDDPAFTDYKLGSVRYTRKPEEARKRWDQACRQKWRVLGLVIKAKLEAVESGIVTFEEEFLAHVLMPDGRTLYENVKETLAVSYDSCYVRPLLGSPA